jgi:phosphotransferase system enzyme I (PtsI)
MDSLRPRDRVVKGLCASPGISRGYAQHFRKGVVYENPVQIKPSQTEKHKLLFTDGREKLKKHFIKLQDESKVELDREIIHTYEQILTDVEIEQRVKNLIDQKKYSADYAVYEAFNVFIELLKDSGSAMFKSRVVDLEEVRDRLINVVCNRASDFELHEDAILIAEDIGPVDLVSMAGKGLKGLILTKGGINSHASILAQSFGIPMVIGVKQALKDIHDGEMLILDSELGDVWINPDEIIQKQFRKKITLIARQEKKLQQILKKPSETASGEKFALYANLEFSSELKAFNKYRAEGIGLLRTESLLFERRDGDHEEKQIEFYREVLNSSKGICTIRLFDVGGDKFMARALNEPNPGLGWRGIRVLLSEKFTLRNQLRAIYRVSAEFSGRIRLLAPMISTIEEIRRLRAVMADVIEEIRSEGHELDEQISLGMMIEVPSSVMMAESFAEYANFFSVGTNDLTQYTLAVDRGNEFTGDLYDQRDPAVWRMLSILMDSAKKTNTPVSVCGELAGDPKSAAVLLGMDIFELSMNPVKIPRVKSLLVKKTLTELREFSDLVRSRKTAKEIKEVFRNWG